MTYRRSNGVTILLTLFLWLALLPLSQAKSIFKNGIYLLKKDSSGELIGTYKNKEYHDVKLTIPNTPNSYALEVFVKGETEKNYDFLWIKNHRNRIIKKYSGRIEPRSFYVEGQHISVVFKADGRTVRSGVHVEVKPRSITSIFRDIRVESVNTAHDLLQQGAQPVTIGLNDITKRLGNLQRSSNSRINSAKSGKSSLSHELSLLAQTYEKISRLRPQLVIGHKRHLDALQKIINKTERYIQQNKQNEDYYIRALNETELDLITIETEIKRQAQLLSISGYQKIIELIGKQRDAWRALLHIQHTLKEELSVYSQNVLLLLHFFSISAQVNQEAANASLANQVNRDDLRNLSNIQELRRIIKDISEIEKRIRALTGKIQKFSI